MGARASAGYEVASSIISTISSIDHMDSNASFHCGRDSQGFVVLIEVVGHGEQSIFVLAYAT